MIKAMVPMRSGSKGIPDKNIKEFLGKPLFRWNLDVLAKCQMTGIIDEVYVNTDSEEYADFVQDYYSHVEIFMRSERTARDGAVNIDVAQEFVEKMDMADDDILLYVQVTSPYLRVEDVKNCLAALETGEFNSAMTVGIDKSGFIPGYDMVKARDTRRQDYVRLKTNGCIYACTTAGGIRRTASLWEEPIYYHVQPYGFELDEPADWVYGEEVMCE